MIILRDVTFSRMARFLHDNVCEMPPGVVTGEMREGLADLLALLKEIYEDHEAFASKDVSSSYLSLLNTIKFLHSFFALGSVRSGEGKSEITVGKPELHQAYRKGNISRIAQHLRRHGLEVRHLRSGVACESLGAATDLVMSSTRSQHLIPLASQFAQMIETVSGGMKDCICDCVATFAKGDYATAAGKRRVPRSTLDPLRPDILKTLGHHRQSWIRTVELLTSRAGLGCSGFMHYHLSPSWSVSFSEGSSRPLAIFTLGSERVFVEFTLPVRHAEEIIRQRHGYAETVRKRIAAFSCVQCPKKCRGKSLSMVDGVALCTGRAEARRIYMDMETPAEFGAIHSMVEMLA